jgi:hypothetical protein
MLEATVGYIRTQDSRITCMAVEYRMTRNGSSIACRGITITATMDGSASTVREERTTAVTSVQCNKLFTHKRGGRHRTLVSSFFLPYVVGVSWIRSDAVLYH